MAVILVALYGCGGGASGGEQTIVESAVGLTGATLRVNNASGSDLADGINEPYQTLQYALNQLRPGDVLVIEDSGQPYSSSAVIGEERDINNALVRTLRGYRVSVSGTQNAPIIIEGRGINRPQIDQMQSSSTPNDATVGLLLECVSHIVIRNLEIYSANEAAITTATDGSCETENIIIEGNHIHNIYGEKYVGGIRMMGVRDAVVRDNHIHDVFSNESAEDKLLIKNGGGIDNVVVENNHFERLDTGVLINAQGLGNSTFALVAEEAATAIQIKNNSFDTVGQAINLTTHISDATSADEQKTGLLKGVDIVGNTFAQIGSALIVSAGDSENQSHDVCVYNNSTIDATASVLDISGVTGFELFNNIFVVPQSEILIARTPANNALLNTIAYSDHNLFYDFVSLRWRLAVNGAAETAYPDLPNWQVAAHPELVTSPDLSAIIADPQFVDRFNNDYSVELDSPAIDAGRFSLTIGADFKLPSPVDMPGYPCAERVLN